jgi:hypothetical protein
MEKFPYERGEGLVEWILIIILALMVLVTIFLLLRPAFGIWIENLLQSVQN